MCPRYVPSSLSCQALLSATLLELWWRELLCRDEDMVLLWLKGLKEQVDRCIAVNCGRSAVYCGLGI